jgi:hypothetical protein
VTFHGTIFIGHPIFDRALEGFETPGYIFERYAISGYSRVESRKRIFSWLI